MLQEDASQYDNFIKECIKCHPKLTPKYLKLTVVGKLTEQGKFNEAAVKLASDQRMNQIHNKIVELPTQESC